MKVFLNLLVISIIIFSLGCTTKVDIPQELTDNYPRSVQFSVENKGDFLKKDALISIEVQDIKQKAADFNSKAYVIVSEGQELPSQMNDVNGNGEMDRLYILCDFSPGEKKIFYLLYAETGELSRTYQRRTQAELSHKFGGKFITNNEGRPEYLGGEFKNVSYLRVPDQHTDHTFFIRYEGPGWESDRIGYRFYLDWRNAIDIFGKKIPDMVLQNVGQDGFESYHEMSDWGMDILKVGDALGIGAVGMWYGGKVKRVSKTDSVTCTIIANGPVQSQIRTNYFGWKVDDGKFDLQSDLSISAGSRLTKHLLKISGEPANLCTGIVKHEGTNLIQSPQDVSGWCYLATYGKQSLADDNLGMAIFYKKENLLNIAEDVNNQVIVLKPMDGKLKYYFLGAWEKEPGGIQTEEQFKIYLEEVKKELDSPLQIIF
jgi:hypothetical protein